VSDRWGVQEFRLLAPVATGAQAGNADFMLDPPGRQTLKQFHIDSNRAARRSGAPAVASFAYLESEEMFGCGGGYHHLFIDAAGNVCPCDLTPLSFGSVVDNSLANIWAAMGEHFPRPGCKCIMSQLAKKTGRLELATVPWITMGHSTGGIFCRNVAFWKTKRVIGVIHIMSGNFQDHIQDKTRSLAGVPFLAINGEFEDCGPAGGDIGRGLRAAYSLHPDNKKKRNQTQWILIRTQMMARRRKNPDNLMSLVVHRESGHVSWSADMTALTAQFIRSAADARIPKTNSDGKIVVACRKLTAKDGWLSDADLKAPKFKSAPHGQYKGDKILAFWHVDKAMAQAVEKYHNRGWKDVDPTAGQPANKRYTPPKMLQDEIDSKVVK